MRRPERLLAEQADDKKQRDRRQTTAQVRQDELGQQRHRALAGLAQVAPHTDDAIKDSVDERACVKAVRCEGTLGLALRAVAGAMRIGVSKLLGILLDRADEWV